MRRSHALFHHLARFEIMLVSLVLFTHLPLLLLPEASLLKWYYTDDAFYYFQVARNITLGNGISFDGISLASGFHPLWMLVCIPVFTLAQINLMLPLRVLVALSAILTCTGGILLYRMVRRVYPRLEHLAVLAAVLWVFYWPLHQVVTQSGMEAGLNGFLLILLLFHASRQETAGKQTPKFLIMAGLIAALALLSRLDNLFLVFFMGLWLVIRNARIRFLVFADVLIVFFSVYSSFILRFGVAGSLPFVSSANLMIVLGLPLLLFINLLLDLYGQGIESRLWRLLGRNTVGTMLVGITLFGAMAILTRQGLISGFPRSVLLIAISLLVLLSTVSRLLARRFFDKTAVPAIYLKYALRSWLLPGLQYFLPVLLLFGSYVAWHWLTFDTPLPVSGQIKQWWGTLPNTIYGHPATNLWQALQINADLCPAVSSNAPWAIAGGTLLLPVNLAARLIGFAFPQSCPAIAFPLTLVYLGLVGGWIWHNKKQIALTGFSAFSLPVLLAVGFLQPFYYAANGYLHTREWYWLDQALAAILLSVVVLACFSLEKPRHKIARWPRLLVYLLCLIIFISFAANLFKVFSISDPTAAYLDPSIPFLEGQTEPGASIGMTGGGVTAYFIQDRTIVNLDGLMNSTEYFELMKQGRAQEYLDRIGLDYAYGNPEVLLNSDPYRWFFTERLVEVASIEGETLYNFTNIGY